MRKLPYHPYDEEDYEIMKSIAEKENSKYKRNEAYIKTSKEIIIQRPYDKIKQVDNGNEQ